MKNLFLMSFASLLLYSCDSVDEQVGLPDDKSNEYAFKKIEYLFAEGSEKSLSSINLPARSYSNGTSLVQTITVNPLEGFVETSQFSSDDINGFTLLADSTLVNTPYYVDESNNISLGSKKWLYSCNVEKQKSNLNLSNSYQIQPNQKLTIKTKLVFQKYSVKYILTLEEKSTGEVQQIEGQWVGEYPINVVIETEYNNL